MAILPLNKGQKRDKTRRMVAFWERGGIPIRDRNQGDSVFLPMEQSIPPHGTKCSTPWNKQEGAAFLPKCPFVTHF